MAGQSTATGGNLAATMNTIRASARLTRDAQKIMRSLATKVNMPVGVGSYDLVTYGRLAAYHLDNGEDNTSAQQLSATVTQMTPTDLAVQVILTRQDVRRYSDRRLMENVGKNMANAYSLQEDRDATAQFSSWTGTAVGAAGTVISPGHIAAMVARVSGTGDNRANPTPPGGRVVGVMHPYQANVLAGRLVPFTDVPTGTNVYGVNTGANLGVTVGVGGAGQLGTEIIRGGIEAIGKVMGAPMYFTPNMAVTTADDARMAVYSTDHLLYIEEFPAGMEEQEWDASARSWELNFDGAYIWGVDLPANSGLSGLFDASTPTS